MEVGVSTACLYPELLENALEELAIRGVKIVEIFINTHCELEPSFAQKLKKIIDENGVKVASVHPFTCAIEPMMFFTPYERRMSDALDYYKKYFEVMNILNANIFVFHGNKPQNPFPHESYFEHYSRLVSLAKEFGVTVVHENVARCCGGNLSFLKEMSDFLGDEVNFLIDIKQAVRSGENPFEILEALKGKVSHIHYSDHNEKHDCLPFGAGNFDSDGFFKALKAQGYDRDVILELYRGNYKDYNALAENYRFLEKAVKSI
ncbi:MAG: sugar phosphate isomerase/epimerase [Oscillospiraceae bacterium]